MSLFNNGEFVLHSGEMTNFLIDCKFLSDEDLDALAATVASNLPWFNRVIGIPNGGIRFATAMTKYVSLMDRTRTLIVDDVYTTGNSMENVKEKAGANSIGLVIFARRKPPSWIQAIFQLDAMKPFTYR